MVQCCRSNRKPLHMPVLGLHDCLGNSAHPPAHSPAPGTHRMQLTVVDDGDTSSADAVAFFAALGVSDPSSVTIASPLPDTIVGDSDAAPQPGGERSPLSAATRLFQVQGADVAPKELTGALSKRQLLSDGVFAVVASNRWGSALVSQQRCLQLAMQHTTSQQPCACALRSQPLLGWAGLPLSNPVQRSQPVPFLHFLQEVVITRALLYALPRPLLQRVAVERQGVQCRQPLQPWHQGAGARRPAQQQPRAQREGGL